MLNQSGHTDWVQVLDSWDYDLDLFGVGNGGQGGQFHFTENDAGWIGAGGGGSNGPASNTQQTTVTEASARAELESSFGIDVANAVMSSAIARRIILNNNVHFVYDPNSNSKYDHKNNTVYGSHNDFSVVSQINHDLGHAANDYKYNLDVTKSKTFQVYGTSWAMAEGNATYTGIAISEEQALAGHQVPIASASASTAAAYLSLYHNTSINFNSLIVRFANLVLTTENHDDPANPTPEISTDNIRYYDDYRLQWNNAHPQSQIGNNVPIFTIPGGSTSPGGGSGSGGGGSGSGNGHQPQYEQ